MSSEEEIIIEDDQSSSNANLHYNTFESSEKFDNLSIENY